MSEIECAQLHSELFRRRHSALAKRLYLLVELTKERPVAQTVSHY